MHQKQKFHVIRSDQGVMCTYVYVQSISQKMKLRNALNAQFPSFFPTLGDT